MKALSLTSSSEAMRLLPAIAREAASAVVIATADRAPDRAALWGVVSDFNVLDGTDAPVLLDAVNAAAAAGISRWIVRSGWLGGEMFDRDPATWGPRGLAAWRAWMDHASGDLAGVRARLLVRPHARHAMCDVQRAAAWIAGLDKEGPARRALFGLVLEPAALLEPEMDEQAEDHLRRAIETLGPRSEAVLLPAEGRKHAGLIEGLVEELAPRTRLIRPA